jgi:predicted lipoprotein with Yx(FWY)xxD motif
MTLYAYSNDVPDQSNCSGTCLTKWPPLLALSGASYSSGVDPALVNSTTLPNGSKIVTYNDMPLYTFSGDVLPGDTNGEGVLNLWYAVSPSGQIINK